jgi:hypothetical protein
LAGALLFCEKISQRDVVFWFGWRDDGIFQVFFSQAVLQRTIVDYTAFLEPGLAKKIAVCLCPYNPSAEEVGGLE